MFSFYPSSNDSIIAWKSYIASRTSLDNLNTSLKKQFHSQKEIAITQFQQNEKLNATLANNTDVLAKQNEMMQKISFDQIQAIEKNTIEVCGTLENGFDLLSESINELGSILDFRLSTIIENQIISNLLAANIALLLKIPDFQKERQYHIEQGLKHFKNASFDPELFNDALENLLKAEKLEKTDYVVLYYIGMIYLYSPNNNDLILAREYFQKALKYSLVETNESATVLANILSGDINKKLDENIANIDSIKNISAKICLQIGITFYIQNMLDEALNFYAKSIELNPKSLEVSINKVRTLILLNKLDEASLLINKLLSENFSSPIMKCLSVTKLLPVFSTDKIISCSAIYQHNLNDIIKHLKDYIISRIIIMKENIVQNSIYKEQLLNYESNVHNSKSLFELIKLSNTGSPTDESFKFYLNIRSRDILFGEDGNPKYLNEYDTNNMIFDVIRENGLYVNILVERMLNMQRSIIKETLQNIELIKQNAINKIETLQVELKKAIEERQKQDNKLFKFNRNYSECIKSYNYIVHESIELENSIYKAHAKYSTIDTNREFIKRKYEYYIKDGKCSYENTINEILVEMRKEVDEERSLNIDIDGEFVLQSFRQNLKSIDLNAAFLCKKYELGLTIIKLHC